MNRFCRPIMTKPRPAPPKPHSPTETPPAPQHATEEAQPESHGKGAEDPQDGNVDAQPAPPEPMETGRAESSVNPASLCYVLFVFVFI